MSTQHLSKRSLLLLPALALTLSSCMQTTTAPHSTTASSTATGASAAGSQASKREATRLVPAQSPEFRLEGRFDMRDAGGPVIVWQASRISIDFTGESLALLFDHGVDQSHFDVEVDGVRRLISIKSGGKHREVWNPPLGPGLHHLSIFKRSEAAAGHVRFTGIEIAKSAVVTKPQVQPRSPALLFIGDSITVGACNEDGEADQWEDRSTHNNARSYGALTAAALNTDYRCIAVSGMGVCEGYVEVKAGEAWNRLYPVASAPIAPPEAGFTPDVIFVNLGENDTSFTHANNRPFPPGYTDGYVALVAAIRQANPGARIVLLRGGMGGGATDPVLRKAWEEAVVRISKVDTNVSHFVFKHWSPLHPRVVDDERMAAELGAWLRAQPWFRRLAPGMAK